MLSRIFIIGVCKFMKFHFFTVLYVLVASFFLFAFPPQFYKSLICWTDFFGQCGTTLLGKRT